MPNATPFLGLITYKSITDASSVLVYDYNDQISGSGGTQNLGILDSSASSTNASLIVINASTISNSASIAIITASLVAMSASPITAPYIDLMPEMSIPPLSGLQAAAFEYVETSSSATNKPVYPQLRFDDITNEGRQWRFRVPTISGSNCVIKVSGRMAGANSTKTLTLSTQFACISVGDTSASSKFFAPINSATVTVPNAANQQFESIITITNSDSIASEDDCTLVLYRDTTDTAVGDFVYTSARIQNFSV